MLGEVNDMGIPSNGHERSEIEKESNRRVREKTTSQQEYDRLNMLWPSELPPLTGPEAITAMKRLHTQFVGHPYKGAIKLTSGNRRTYRRYGVFRLNPDQGWRYFCHDLSHAFHRLRHPGDRPHSQNHVAMEFAIVKHVKDHGWLEGKLKRSENPKATVDFRKVRYNLVVGRLTIWRAKLKRAETAIKKLEQKRKYYEKIFAVEAANKGAAE